MSVVRRNRNRSRGAVAVEMALVLPLLAIMLLAATEFGRMFYQYNTLSKAVRDGARYAASNAFFGDTGNIDTSTIEGTVRNLVVYGNIAGSGQKILNGMNPNSVSITAPNNEYVLVTASYPYQPMFNAISMFNFSGQTDTAVTFNVALRMRAL